MRKNNFTPNLTILKEFTKSLYKLKNLLPHIDIAQINLSYNLIEKSLSTLTNNNNEKNSIPAILYSEPKELKESYKLINPIDNILLEISNQISKIINSDSNNLLKIDEKNQTNTIYDIQDIFMISLNIKPKILLLNEINNESYLSFSLDSLDLDSNISKSNNSYEYYLSMIKEEINNIFPVCLFLYSLPNKGISITEQNLEILENKLKTVFGKSIDIRICESTGRSNEKLTYFDLLVYSSLITVGILNESWETVLPIMIKYGTIGLTGIIAGWLTYKLTNWLADTIDEFSDVKEFIEKVYHTEYQTFLTKLFLKCVITNVSINIEEYKKLRTNDEKKEFLDKVSDNCSKELKTYLTELNNFISEACDDMFSPRCIEQFKLRFKDIDELLTKYSIQDLSKQCNKVCGENIPIDIKNLKRR